MILPIAQALAEAHAKNIIHRDIKPSNILITPSGLPMLSDFGIAKIVQPESSSASGSTIEEMGEQKPSNERRTDLSGTVLGTAIGTPEYMAPEQWLGGTIDQRSDIYALGVVLYEMVTGKTPFAAETVEAVRLKALLDPLVSPKKHIPNIPFAFEKIIIKALARNPENRYQSMNELAGALQVFLKNPEKSNNVWKYVSLTVLAIIISGFLFFNISKNSFPSLFSRTLFSSGKPDTVTAIPYEISTVKPSSTSTYSIIQITNNGDSSNSTLPSPTDTVVFTPTTNNQPAKSGAADSGIAVTLPPTNSGSEDPSMIFNPGKVVNFYVIAGINTYGLVKKTVTAFWIDKNQIKVNDFKKFVEETGYITDAEKAGIGYYCSVQNSKLDGQGRMWIAHDVFEWSYCKEDWRDWNCEGNDSGIPNFGIKELGTALPVVQVSYNDAQKYCEYQGKRLVKDEEWYAAYESVSFEKDANGKNAYIEWVDDGSKSVKGTLLGDKPWFHVEDSELFPLEWTKNRSNRYTTFRCAKDG